ncbi:hypothetical protein I4U23_002455 [Adineta vaga]|nr:hypothetical protein I4U23_002455 [Adineta vaga]
MNESFVSFRSLQVYFRTIIGNCEIAELLMRIADKMNVRLDQCVNREGCSAAVLALRYGHIECANQITHRNWDEFFVVPRPLSVYESPPINDRNHNRITTFTPTKQMSKTSQTNKMNKRPSSLSFGLLKILFNDSDAPYSTHLAKLCNQGKQNHHRQARQKNPELSCTLKKREQNKSNVTNGTQHSSVETVITDTNPRKKRQERKSSADAKEKVSPDKTGLPPRRPSSVHQHRNSRDTQFSIERVKHPMNVPIIHIQDFDASASRSQSITIIPVPKPSRVNVNTERPKTPPLTRHKTSNDISDVQYPVYTRKIPLTSIHKKMKKKSTTNNRPKSAAFTFKPQYSNMTFESSTYSKTLYTGRPLSAVLQNHHCRSPVQHIVDPSCSIREVTGVAAASRYNNPVELFGIKPEELFGSPDNTAKSITHHDTQLKRSNTQQQYMYQQEIDKFADLYAIQHTFSYRPSVKPPVKPRGNTSDLKSNDKNRKTSTSKNSMNSSRASTTLKPSTLAILNINRRFSEYRRPTVKTVHT